MQNDKTKLKTRIREFRKKSGLTLQELAQRIGTTAQTVQRLETANMTVSTDWLEKFAATFKVHPADLIARDDERGAKFLGSLSSERIIWCAENDSKTFDLTIPGNNPIAVSILESHGPYAKDTILVADRLDPSSNAIANGKDCIVKTKQGEALLMRVIFEGERTTLVPYNQNTQARHNPEIDWLAPIIMTVKYIQ